MSQVRSPAPAPVVWRMLPPVPRLGGGRHLIERNLVFFRTHLLVIFGGFFEALFYLASIGVGVSSLVGDIEGPGGVRLSYVEFLAPAMLAASAMNGAVMETFNTFFKLHYAKAYEAVLATPMTVRDIAAGEVVWALARGGLYSVTFVSVMAALGLVGSWWGLLALPGAVLIGFAFAAVGMAAVTFMRGWQDFDYFFGVITPLFLLSATFYPLSTYPEALEWVVRATPLYHGVALERALVVGEISVSLVGHVGYLVVLGVVAMTVASRRLERLLHR